MRLTVDKSFRLHTTTIVTIRASLVDNTHTHQREHSEIWVHSLNNYQYSGQTEMRALPIG